MTKRHLLISTLVLLAALGCVNSLVKRSARTVPHGIFDEINRTQAPDYLMLGNSLVAAGVDEIAFRAGLPAHAGTGPILNTGCGGTLPSETIQFYLAARRKFPRLPCVIMGFMFTQLTAPPEAAWHELAGNRALFYYSDFELGLSFYRPGSWLEKTQFQLTRHLPVVYERQSIWRRVELVRRNFEQWGMPREETTRFGRVVDFESDPYQPKSPSALADECRTAVAEHRILSPPVLQIIRQAKAAGSKIFLVQMPLPLARRNHFAVDDAWEKYQNYIRDRVESEGTVFVNALEWFSDDGHFFMDSLHLSKAGAEAFSKRLAPIVAVKTSE